MGDNSHITFLGKIRFQVMALFVLFCSLLKQFALQLDIKFQLPMVLKFKFDGIKLSIDPDSSFVHVYIIRTLEYQR